MVRKIVITTALLGFAAAAAPLLVVSKWIGRFTLTVDLEVASGIDPSSITYVACWNLNEAERLVNDQSPQDAVFVEPDTKSPHQHTITIKCVGESDGYGLLDSYHHPRFLVVQYRDKNIGDDPFLRKRITIPTGRGPRSMTLKLP